MSLNSIQKFAFQLYDLTWHGALPCLRLNRRLSAGFAQRTLYTALPAADVWIQAASVGEAYLATEIIRSLKPAESLKLLVTTNTSQGIDILTRNPANRQIGESRIQLEVGYFPFDKPGIMQRAVNGIKPRVMVLLETEIWPGLLLSLKKHRCKILIVNGRITEKSLRRYLLWPSIWPKIRPDKVLAISRSDARRFSRLFGAEGVEVMPNIKFDRIAPTTSHSKNINTVKAIVPDVNPFVVLASVRHAEADFVKKIIRQVLQSRPKTIIGLFPRHLHRIKFWQKTFRQMGIRYILRSKTGSKAPSGIVILWDTFGELLPAYQTAESAFVGGSLAPLGGQNFLEALVSGVIPIIGPWWENFSWVGREIIESGLLRVAGDWKEVTGFILNDLENRLSRADVTAAALRYFEAHRGGTEQACRLIMNSLESN